MLEVADALAELLPFAGVRGRDLEGTLGDPDGLRRDPRAAAVERAHREVEAVALGADPVRGRDPYAVESELGGRAAADPHLVLDAGDAEAVAPAPRRRSTRGADGARRPGS